MTRYVIKVGSQWVTSLYDASSSGVGLTPVVDDASSWSLYETAQEKALILRKIFQDEVRIEERTEPDYPRSWHLAFSPNS